jgi:hypothetical protein
MNHLTIRPYILVLQIVRAARKGTRIDCVKSYYLQTYLQQDLLTKEQNISEHNALYGTLHGIFTPTCVRMNLISH